MAKRQTRRSVSIRGTTHERAKRALKRLSDNGTPAALAGLVDRLLTEFCERHQEPEVKPWETKIYPTKRTEADHGEIIRAHFTF